MEGVATFPSKTAEQVQGPFVTYAPLISVFEPVSTQPQLAPRDLLALRSTRKV